MCHISGPVRRFTGGVCRRAQASTQPGHLSGSYPGRVQACTRQVYGSRTPGNVRILGISGRVYGSIRPGNVGFCPVVALGRHTQLCKVPGLSPYVTHRAGSDAKTDFCSVPLACFLCVRYI
ncbi:hypothetical protein Bbelb_377500 [Branchiostoma belcheri]|nr:hypothetical protein Bbelb_377500 [Branchiostoma belcheri]